MMRLLLLFSLAAIATAYPTGAPDELCDADPIKLQPHHVNPDTNQIYDSQSGSAPFTVTASGTSFSSDKDTITVRIKVKDAGGHFLGFAVMAQDPQTKKPIGKWDGTAEAHALKCNGIVTHNSNNKKTDITLKWHPSQGSSGNVKFVATIVEKFSTYWINVPVST